MSDSTSLRHRVLEELEWEPSVDASHIGVAVSQPGIVTLSGTVTTYAEKIGAQRTANAVAGVRVVANDIAVRLRGSMRRSDTDIAQCVALALEWDIAVPHEQITARVEDGWVTLEGEVGLKFQQDAAEKVVRRVVGLRGVTNLIRLQMRPAVKPAEVRLEPMTLRRWSRSRAQAPAAVGPTMK